MRKPHLVTRLPHARFTKAIRKLYVPPVEPMPLSPAEAKLADELADKFGMTRDEAVNAAISGSFERRTRKNTGKAPAKVYSFKKKKKP
jgi:hypothetical protein